jgi:hypothetical protein
MDSNYKPKIRVLFFFTKEIPIDTPSTLNNVYFLSYDSKTGLKSIKNSPNRTKWSTQLQIFERAWTLVIELVLIL